MISALEEFLPGFDRRLKPQLLDIADEIAYNTADLDDAYSIGLITATTFANGALFAARGRGGDDVSRRNARLRFNEVQRAIINELVGGFVAGARLKP